MIELDLAHDLYDQGCLSERVGEDERLARCAAAVGALGLQVRLKDRALTSVRLDAPDGSPCPHTRPDRELSTRGAILDVAVREPKDENRRSRDRDTVLLSITRSR